MSRAGEDSASPCISICKPDGEGRYCLGCYRTLREIARWPELSAAERRAVTARAAARRKKNVQPTRN